MKTIKKISLLLILTLICFSTCFSAKKSVNIPKFNLPVLITSAGQSIEAQMVSFKCQQAHIQNTCEPLATNKDLAGIKTLIIVPGHSLKGLGSAGIDADQDLARIKKLLAAAKNQKISIVCIHIGGTARRGPTSKPFIDAALDYAQYCVVYSEGNTDQYFTKVCQSKKIPLTVMPKAADLDGVTKMMFSGK